MKYPAEENIKKLHTQYYVPQVFLIQLYLAFALLINMIILRAMKAI